MDERNANILINKAGGNASPDAKSYRVALPSAWMNALGVDEEHREVTLQFDGEAITIRRQSPTGYEDFLADARRRGHELLVIHFYDGETLCTKICADRTARTLVIRNETDEVLSTAFGVNETPSWSDLEAFLRDRCLPRQRDGLDRYLASLGLSEYDPLAIIRKTQGRMAEDDCWLKILEG
ncbi:hypothetical protein [Dysosmobacter sp.]